MCKSHIRPQYLIWAGIAIFIALVIVGVIIMFVNGQTVFITSVAGAGVCMVIIMQIIVYHLELYDDTNPADGPLDIV